MILSLVLAMAMGLSNVYGSEIGFDNKVSLTFDDTPISAVLKMLAAQNNLNLVVSSEVKGEISITLEDVTLRAALDAIVLPNGYSYYTNEDIIIVKAADQKAAGELTPIVYQLKYIDAEIAREAVTPLLSTNGQANSLSSSSPDGSTVSKSKSTRLVVIDNPGIQKLVADFLNQIDKRRRQISVEVKIIETNLNKDEKLGINWPKLISSSLAGVGGSESTIGDESISDLAQMPLETGNWQLGYLSIHQLDIVLDFLEKRNDAKLLSNPRLTTLENETATIEIQTNIPIQTINRFSEGAIIQDIVSWQDEKVGISLKVTARINDDSTITMEVHPVVEEIIGYTGPADNQRPITSERTIKTIVTVKNGETIVLGGLLKETSFETKEKLFLLGSIPILGALFTHTTTEIKTTDLLILITPKILD